MGWIIRRLSKEGMGQTVELHVESKTEIVPNKRRVVIYGNNWDDKVYGVADWVDNWLNDQGLNEELESHICKIRPAIETAFFGQDEDTDPKSIPALVMAGKNIRDTLGGGWSDFSIEPEMQRIKKLCQTYGVPLIRYEFNKETGLPRLTEGEMPENLSDESDKGFLLE